MEAAIVLPILVLLVMGVVEFGMLFFSYMAFQSVEQRPCAAGSYMYHGWVDRPPESGPLGVVTQGLDVAGSDRDYNDITFTLKCRVSTTSAKGSAGLVR